jgi:hypothetical protein
VVDGGGITSFHVIWGLEENFSAGSWFFGKGEDLEKSAVEGDKVLFYELVSGLQVLLYGQVHKRADSVVAVERKPVSVGCQNKEDIEEQLVMAKADKKAVPQKAMLDKGEAAGDLADTIMA